MEVPCKKGVAIHLGPRPCGDSREGAVEAWAGESVGRVLSRERNINPGADAVVLGGRQHRGDRYREVEVGWAWSETPSTHGNLSHGSREAPQLAARMVVRSAEGTNG
jgi:hypothetical protein